MSNLTPNTYFGHLVEAVLAEVGDNKTPVLLLTFELTHEATSGAWTEITEVKRDVQFYLSDKAKEGSFADLRQIGFNGDMEAPRFTDEDLYKGCELLVENETFNGKIYDRVRIGKLKRGAERKPVGKDLARSLAAQFRTSAQATARPSAPPPPMQRTVVKEAAAAAPATGPAAPPPPSKPVDPNEPPF